MKDQSQVNDDAHSVSSHSSYSMIDKTVFPNNKQNAEDFTHAAGPNARFMNKRARSSLKGNISEK